MLIESTVEKIENGTSLAGVTNESFSEVLETVAKVNELISDVSWASQEQANGVTQLNTNVTQIDGVTQQNTASADQVALAASQLNEEAGSLGAIVDEFVIMVEGQGIDSSAGSKPTENLMLPEVS